MTVDKIDEYAMQIYMNGNCTLKEAYRKAKSEVECGLPKEFEELLNSLKRR